LSESLSVLVAGLRREVATLQSARRVDLGRRGATVDSTINLAVGSFAANGGPHVDVFVGPSGRLTVTASARLVAPTGERASMGWQLVGPFLDKDGAPIAGEPSATVVAADAARALAVKAGTGGAAELTASHVTELAGLVPGWYDLDARYALTAGAGTAAYRQLIAAPL
jgi:hypothetical protein